MICASSNLLFFTSVPLSDGILPKLQDREGGRSQSRAAETPQQSVDR